MCPSRYLGGVFDIETLVENLLQQLASKQTILVNVYDTTNHSQPISMYGSHVSADGLEHVSPLNFGDPFRKHEMRCRYFGQFSMSSVSSCLLQVLTLGCELSSSLQV